MSTQATGTNSPPIEATATTNPTGKSGKDGETAEGISDETQRAGYFGGGDQGPESADSGNDINAGKQAALDSIAKTDQKWDAEHNRAQQF